MPGMRMLLAVLLATAMLLVEGVAPAQAGVYRSFTTFSWSGKSCVEVFSPVMGKTTVCDNATFGFHQINEIVVYSGQWIGVRVPLAGQNHVECAAWLGPDGGLQSVFARDSADSSLGTGEADCLRQVP